MDYQTTLETAVTIAREAGSLLMEGYTEDMQVDRKSSAVDWVTPFDRASEALIVERLRRAFPDHGLIGEEGANHDARSAYVWYIDPLDGTNNFAHGFPFFCVSLGLYAGEDPLLGIIYDPVRDECFTAVSGQGAHLQTANGSQSLHVTREKEMVNSLLATGFPYDRIESLDQILDYLRVLLPAAHGIRRAGSAALDMAYVAAGRLDGYWEMKVHSWDVAAGIVLVAEAGGQVTTLDGRPLSLTPQLSMLATNTHLHPPMLAALQAATSNS